nr:NAD(P)/FAD-dependent oxidoreductase [Xenococcus sp. MO_188.B8]
AQVAYQQGKAIAHNLIAKVNGHPLKPANVRLRGSMMKLGIDESVANIFDRIEVSGEVGHLIREATYLELLPCPIHDFKVTTTWIIDEIFHRHSS